MYLEYSNISFTFYPYLYLYYLYFRRKELFFLYNLMHKSNLFFQYIIKKNIQDTFHICIIFMNVSYFQIVMH